MSSSILILIGVLAMRWNVVIGGQLFSKSLRGFTTYNMAISGREGLLASLGLLLLPFGILFVFLKVFLPAATTETSPAPFDRLTGTSTMDSSWRFLVNAPAMRRLHREKRLLYAGAGRPGERYILGSENLEWPAIHALISDLCGVPGPHYRANHTTSYLAAAAQEMVSLLIGTRPLVTRPQAKMVGRFYWYAHDLAAQRLGCKPRPARQALSEAIAWLIESRHISPGMRASMKLSHEVLDAGRSRQTGELVQ